MGDTKRLVSNTAVIFVGSTTASVFSYLFNMLMGRMLGPAQYGEMAAILSLLMIMSVGGTVLMTTTMFYVGEMYGLGNFSGIKRLFEIFTKYVLLLSLLFFLVGSALARPIADFFSISHVVPVVIAFSGFIFGFIILINRGILQGTQQFVAFTLIGILEMFLKVLVAVLLVRAGFALGGAIAATVIASVATYFVSLRPLTKLWRNIKQDEPAQFHFHKKEIFAYVWPVFISTLLLTVLINLDVILVKHYFPNDQAGLYAAVSTVGKIILYLTSPVISVMFPMILEKKSQGKKHFKMLFFSLALTAIGALIIMGVYSVVPSLVIRILYGKGYTALNYLLPQIGIFVLFYTLVNLLANYFLAIKNFVFLIFMAIAAILVVVWTGLSHGSIVAIIRIFTVSDGLLFAAMIGYYLYTKKNQLTQYFKGNYEG